VRRDFRVRYVGVPGLVEREVTEEELKKLEELANAAWPGPWLVIERPYGWDVRSDADRMLVADDVDKDEAEFIAEARTAIPKLIEEVRALRADLGYACEALDAISDYVTATQKSLDEINLLGIRGENIAAYRGIQIRPRKWDV
jgi:hypothetical protein